MSRPRVPPTEDYISASSTPSYTSEYLTLLKAATATPPSRAALRNDVDQAAGSDPVYNVEELESLGVADIIDGVSFESPQLYESHFRHAELKTFREIELSEAPSIPTGGAVVDAKKERERRRITGVTPQAGGEEFISLSLTKRSETRMVDDGPHPESRLMREDDDLGEGDDGASCLMGSGFIRRLND